MDNSEFLARYLLHKLDKVRNWRADIDEQMEDKEEGSLKLIRYKSEIYEEFILIMLSKLTD